MGSDGESKSTQLNDTSPRSDPSPPFPSSSTTPDCSNLPDYKGYIYSNFARGTWLLFGVVFLGPALLVLAERDVGSNGKLYGIFKASALVSTLYVIFVALIVILGPIVGALSDFTSHRKTILGLCYGGCVACILLCLILTSSTYLIVAWLLLVTLVLAELAGVPINAYLPEMSSEYKVITLITAKAQVYYVVVGLLFAAFATAINLALGLSTVNQVRVAILLCVAFSFPSAVYSYQKFTPRGPTRQLQPNDSLWAVGFIENYRLVGILRTKYPQMLQLLTARAFYYGLQRAITGLATTYLVTQIGLSSSQVSNVLLVGFLMGIPGAFVLQFLAVRVPQRMVLLGTLYVMLISFLLIPFVFYKNSQADLSYFFASVWGLATGTLGAIDSAFFSTFIPGGKEAELFGLYTFTSSIIEWAPPLLFTVFNLATGSFRWVFSLLSIFQVIGLCLVHTLDVETGQKLAQATVGERHRSSLATPGQRDASLLELGTPAEERPYDMK